MRKTLGEIAKVVGGEVIGDPGLVITGLSGIQEAQEGDLTFIGNSKYIPLAKTTKAAAVIISDDVKIPGKSVIATDNASLAFAKIVSLIAEDHSYRLEGIHPTAFIDQDVTMGKGVSIGPYTIVEKGCQIGDGSVIYGGCYVGHDTVVGKQCLVYPRVVIREKITIKDRVTIHSGTVIGSDGFGYEQINGVHEKIPQIGSVVIEDDVEIGANVTIDRARFDKTIIGKGTKIDNLVQIAHNVRIGENCIIVAQVGISGSTAIEKGSILAGQSGVAGHLTIGEGSIVASRSGVTKSLPPKSKVLGYPAKPFQVAKRINACVQKLPSYIKTIRELEEKVKKLEQKLNDLSK